MIEIVLLWGKDRYAVEHWDQAPDLVEYNGQMFSLRAGPRTPLPGEQESEPVAVYAADELTEEEFQDLFFAVQPQVPALGLKYS